MPRSSERHSRGTTVAGASGNLSSWELEEFETVRTMGFLMGNGYPTIVTMGSILGLSWMKCGDLISVISHGTLKKVLS